MTILRHGFYVKNKHGLSGGAVSAFLVEVRAALERKEVEWGMESKDAVQKIPKADHECRAGERQLNSKRICWRVSLVSYPVVPQTREDS